MVLSELIKKGEVVGDFPPIGQHDTSNEMYALQK